MRPGCSKLAGACLSFRVQVGRSSGRCLNSSHHLRALHLHSLIVHPCGRFVPFCLPCAAPGQPPNLTGLLSCGPAACQSSSCSPQCRTQSATNKNLEGICPTLAHWNPVFSFPAAALAGADPLANTRYPATSPSSALSIVSLAVSFQNQPRKPRQVATQGRGMCMHS
jgi:hypothetical protein